MDFLVTLYISGGFSGDFVYFGGFSCFFFIFPDDFLVI